MATRKKQRATKKRAAVKPAPKKRRAALAPATKPKRKVATRTSSKPTATAAATTTTTTTAAVTLSKLPVVWRVETGSQCVGLWVDEEVWAANDQGAVFNLDKDGNVLRSLKLPFGSLCVLADEVWKFAGCKNGKVYDLTGRVPQALYEIEGGKQLDWLEMYRGTLCVSDHEGGLTVIDADGSVRWQKRDKKASDGWMVRADASGVWHGSMAGLRKYSWDGTLEWTRTEMSDVRFAWPQGDEMVVLGGWQKAKKSSVHVVDRDGKPRVSWTMKASSSVWQQIGRAHV